MTKSKDNTWFKKLYDQFIDVRKEAGRFSEKEINRVIDKTLKKVRKTTHSI